MSKKAKTDTMKEILEDGKILKRFSLTTEEREAIQAIQNVLYIIRLQREGLNHSILLEITKARQRLAIEQDAPEGYRRIVDFDPQTYEILVIDIPEANDGQPAKTN